jgi:hypothetical protein
VKSRGPGAPTLALSLRIRTAGDGGKKARSPGRSRISRNTIVQGMPADAVYPWLLTPVLFFCTGGHGCNAHPAFPAPSVEEGGTSRIKPRAKQAARSKGRGCEGSRRGGLFDSWIMAVDATGRSSASTRATPSVVIIRMRMIQYSRDSSGVHSGTADAATPLPNPPPQGGRARTAAAASTRHCERKRSNPGLRKDCPRGPGVLRFARNDEAAITTKEARRHG